MAVSAKPDTSSPAAEAWAVLQDYMFRTQRPRMLSLCAEFEITPPQLMTLKHLDDRDRPIPMSDIARLLACDASNVTGIIDRLEARGFVERRSAPGDRRVKMLALTAQGEAACETLGERMAQPPVELAGLSRADQRVLVEILRRALAPSDGG